MGQPTVAAACLLTCIPDSAKGAIDRSFLRPITAGTLSNTAYGIYDGLLHSDSPYAVPRLRAKIESRLPLTLDKP